MKIEDKRLWDLHHFDCCFCDQGPRFSQYHLSCALSKEIDSLSFFAYWHLTLLYK
jgi:hypothetical protein